MISNIATQVLNFFQTTRRVLYWSSLLALVLALLSFPLWHQIFTEHNLPVSVRMAAPGSEYVKVYWDDPKFYPTAYEQIAVNSDLPQTWQIKIAALAQKNRRSQGQEVWVLNISTPERRVDWSQLPAEKQQWELRKDPNDPQGKIAIVSGRKPQSLARQIDGSKLTIKLLRHPWSGKVRVTVNNRVREIDLFSERPSIETLTFSKLPGDKSFRNYQIKAVDTPWHRLKFIADAGVVKVEQIKVRDRLITNRSHEAFLLPFRFWNRFSCAVFSTVISFFLMTCLFISTVHLWQEKPHKRWGIWSYIIGIAISLSGFWMLVFYPALMSPDSLDQWSQALSEKYLTWHPPIMAMLMHGTQWFTSSPSLFCFIQGFLFWSSILILWQQIASSSKRFMLGTIVIIMLPSLWTYSAVLWKDVWTAIFALYSTSALIHAVKYKKQRIFWLSVALLSLAVCFRHNAIFMAAVPLLLGVAFFWQKFNLYKIFFRVTLVLILLIAPAKLIEKLPNVTNNSPTAFVFINQYVGTLVNAKSQLIASELATEQQAIDGKFGAGVFEQLMKKYDCGSASYIYFSQPPIITPSQIADNTSFILNKTFEIGLKYPFAYLQHRICNLAYLFQIPSVSYPFHPDVNENQLGIRADSRLPEIRNWAIAFLTKTLDFPWLWRTYIFAIWLIVSLVLSFFTKNHILLIPSIIGIAYAASYLVTDIFPDWRYLLLTYICSWICILGWSDYYLKRLRN